MMITREEDGREILQSIYEKLELVIEHAKMASDPFAFLCNQIEAMHNTDFSIRKRAELSTAELPVQGEAVAIADSITLRMLKTWCHTNRFRIEIDLGGVATAGTFGNMRRLWDADLLTMFPALNTRRESDTTPTLKPSVNEMVKQAFKAGQKASSAVDSVADEICAELIASHQSAKEQV
jgi:hypothetical protein